jgi:cytochrome c-type biogenesis protein CcmF
MAVILVGLIGSSMYVTESSGYLPFDEESDTATGEFVVRDYRLVYVTNEISSQRSGEATYHVTFDVYQGETYRGQVSPGIELVEATQQRKPLAAVLSAPLEDLFVVYNGVNDESGLSLSAFINPCISFVWAGFALLMLGTAIAALGRFRPSGASVRKAAGAGADAGAGVGADADAQDAKPSVAAASTFPSFGGGSSARETHRVSSENGSTDPRTARSAGVVSTVADTSTALDVGAQDAEGPAS